MFFVFNFRGYNWIHVAFQTDKTNALYCSSCTTDTDSSSQWDTHHFAIQVHLLWDRSEKARQLGMLQNCKLSRQATEHTSCATLSLYTIYYLLNLIAPLFFVIGHFRHNMARNTTCIFLCVTFNNSRLLKTYSYRPETAVKLCLREFGLLITVPY